MASRWSSLTTIAPHNILTSKFEKYGFDRWTDGCVRNWQDEQVQSYNQWLDDQVETMSIVLQRSLLGSSIVIQDHGTTKLRVSSHQGTIMIASIPVF